MAWSYRLRDRRFSVERREEGKAEILPMEFSFGSGRTGTTFVTTLESASGAPPIGIEHRLSFRDSGRELLITPGQERGAPSEPAATTTPSGRLLSESPLLRETMPASVFTDHWIRVHPAGPAAPQRAQNGDEVAKPGRR